MREAKLKEIISIATKLRGIELLDFEKVKALPKYYPGATTAKFFFGSEYNDEDYSFKVTSFDVFDKNGDEIPWPEFDDTNEASKFEDLAYYISDSKTCTESEDDDVIIEYNFKTKSILGIPKLYLE